MENRSIHYATFDFKKDGKIDLDTREWHDDMFRMAESNVVARNGSICALFYAKDIQGYVSQNLNEDALAATREQFETEPVKYGVCLYKQPFVGGKWVFE